MPEHNREMNSENINNILSVGEYCLRGYASSSSLCRHNSAISFATSGLSSSWAYNIDNMQTALLTAAEN